LHSRLLAVVSLISIMGTLSGCATPVLVAGAAVGAASVAADRRTTAAMVDDQTIELKAQSALNDDTNLADNARVSATSFNGVLLLTGQASTPALREQAIAEVRGLAKVRQIHDAIEIAPPTSAKQQSTDTWITTRVKSELLSADGLEAARIKVVTENDVVYLMGLVTHAEGDSAARTAQKVEGVKRIVTVFEYTD